jgi:alpha-L-fucosidase
MKKLLLFALSVVPALLGCAQTPPSTPAWFDEAKFGIFIHWGVYSVPAWNYPEKIENPAHWSEPLQAYGEWYWHSLTRGYEPVQEFHTRVYGDQVAYPDLAAQFKAELFDPTQWAQVFRQSGAKYVVMVAKHHDGYALWPSAYSWNWNSGSVGPHRDLLGEVLGAVREVGLKAGVSYSLDAWFDPLYLNDFPAYVNQKLQPQLRELVTEYRPDIIVLGGHVQHTTAEFKNDAFADWLYHESPVKDAVVVNDRWGSDSEQKMGNYFTTQYSDVDQARDPDEKWEEMRGIGKSFGYSRVETLEDYMSSEAVVELLVKVVANGGNLLLNIGPTADGRIPVIMQQRLADVGAWLETNGEAIYATRPCAEKIPGQPYVTETDDALYVHLLKWPLGELTLALPEELGAKQVTLLGHEGPVSFEREGNSLIVSIPYRNINIERLRYAYVLKITK